MRKIIREQLKKELNEEKYYRLSNKMIGNTLYPLTKKIKGIYDTLSKGDDLDMKQLDGIILSLQKLKDSAKSFEAGTKLNSIPKEYR